MNIYEKINAIMESVESLQKDGRVAFGSTKYNYLSEAKTTTEMRKQLIKHKLVLLPIKAEEIKEGAITKGMYTYRLLNAENPDEYIDLMAGGQGHDSADKGSGKASSYAYKYLMWRTFAIPSNDDPDQISSDEIIEQEKLKQKKIEKPHLDFLNRMIKETETDECAFLTFMKIEKLEDMTVEQFTNKAKPALEKKAKDMKKK
ncbi:MAG TPA: hypothetical protein GX729_07270 [Firmicutes bacterium]|nr:hypothetical protein [Bacillota bacterium]